MFEEVDWIFFDLGYTLVDEEESHRVRIERLLEKLPAHYTYDDIYQKLLEASKRYEPPFISLMTSLKLVDYEPCPSELEKLFPIVPALLDLLQKRYKLGVIANQKLGTEDRLQNFGILQNFDLVVSSTEVGLSKPDPAIFQLALEKENCQPERALMVGDRLDNDIFPAKKLGMQTIWVRQGFGGFQEPKSVDYEPDLTIQSIEEVEVYL